MQIQRVRFHNISSQPQLNSSQPFFWESWKGLKALNISAKLRARLPQKKLRTGPKISRYLKLNLCLLRTLVGMVDDLIIICFFHLNFWCVHWRLSEENWNNAKKFKLWTLTAEIEMSISCHNFEPYSDPNNILKDRIIS